MAAATPAPTAAPRVPSPSLTQRCCCSCCSVLANKRTTCCPAVRREVYHCRLSAAVHSLVSPSSLLHPSHTNARSNTHSTSCLEVVAHINYLLLPLLSPAFLTESGRRTETRLMQAKQATTVIAAVAAGDEGSKKGRGREREENGSRSLAPK